MNKEIWMYCEELKQVRDEKAMEILTEGFTERWQELEKHEEQVEFDILWLIMEEHEKSK